MHTREQNGFHRHTGEIAEDFDRTLCFLRAVAVQCFFLCSCRSHSFHAKMELSVDCFQLFMFCLWAHVIRAEMGNLPSSCAIKTERTLISGLLVESHK